MHSYLSDFIQYIADKYDDEELKDIAAYGIEAVGTAPWIFYEDSTIFWDTHKELCEGASVELAFDVYDISLVDLIKRLDTGNEEWHNIKQNLLYALVEYSAAYLIGDEI